MYVGRLYVWRLYVWRLHVWRLHAPSSAGHCLIMYIGDDLDVKSLFSLHKIYHPEESKRVTESGGKISGEYVVHPTDDAKVLFHVDCACARFCGYPFTSTCC